MYVWYLFFFFFISLFMFVFFFFFQAEDGIRDWSVTGVQTCALPIWSHGAGVPRRRGEVRALLDLLGEGRPPVPSRALRAVRPGSGGKVKTTGSDRTIRSEERRVGKECRSRGAADHERKKENNPRRSE